MGNGYFRIRQAFCLDKKQNPGFQTVQTLLLLLMFQENICSLCLHCDLVFSALTLF